MTGSTLTHRACKIASGLTTTLLLSLLAPNLLAMVPDTNTTQSSTLTTSTLNTTLATTHTSGDCFQPSQAAAFLNTNSSNCFIFPSEKPHSFDEGQQICSHLRSNLMLWRNLYIFEAEEAFLQEGLESKQPASAPLLVWVGLRLKSGKTWKWEDGNNMLDNGEVEFARPYHKKGKSGSCAALVPYRFAVSEQLKLPPASKPTNDTHLGHWFQFTFINNSDSDSRTIWNINRLVSVPCSNRLPLICHRLQKAEVSVEQKTGLCANKECPGNKECHVEGLLWVCRCAAGFKEVQATCVDVDECSGGGACHRMASCENTPGSYQCQCFTGFTGNGEKCLMLEECNADNIEGCPEHCRCRLKEAGYVSCDCPYDNVGLISYFGIGFCAFFLIVFVCLMLFVGFLVVEKKHKREIFSNQQKRNFHREKAGRTVRRVSEEDMEESEVEATPMTRRLSRLVRGKEKAPEEEKKVTVDMSEKKIKTATGVPNITVVPQPDLARRTSSTYAVPKFTTSHMPDSGSDDMSSDWRASPPSMMPPAAVSPMRLDGAAIHRDSDNTSAAGVSVSEEGTTKTIPSMTQDDASLLPLDSAAASPVSLLGRSMEQPEVTESLIAVKSEALAYHDSDGGDDRDRDEMRGEGEVEQIGVVPDGVEHDSVEHGGVEQDGVEHSGVEHGGVEHRDNAPATQEGSFVPVAMSVDDAHGVGRGSEDLQVISNVTEHVDGGEDDFSGILHVELQEHSTNSKDDESPRSHGQTVAAGNVWSAERAGERPEERSEERPEEKSEEKSKERSEERSKEGSGERSVIDNPSSSRKDEIVAAMEAHEEESMGLTLLATAFEPQTDRAETPALIDVPSFSTDSNHQELDEWDI